MYCESSTLPDNTPSPGTIGLAALRHRSCCLLGCFRDTLEFGFISVCYPDIFHVPGVPDHRGAAPIRMPSTMRDLLLHCLPYCPRLCLALSSSQTFDVRIVQYSVSVIVDGVVPIEVRVCTLLGLLLGGIRATSAYDGDALRDGCMLDS
jgi:hypothetical protein